MTAPWLGCIADDYTGGTDLASMLVRAGLRVVQCFCVPTETEGFEKVDAIVVSLKSRSAPPEKAVEWSMLALRFLQSMGIERFFFKYCSTFDSTPTGNIGPVVDALADALDAGEVVFCPAFPENGRTVYCGHLFVGGVPLHESGMRNHPLTPMTDSNLIRVLRAQTSQPVELLSLTGKLHSDRSLGEPRRHVIVDAICNDDLRRIAKLARDHQLLTGASAISKYWAEELSSVVSHSCSDLLGHSVSFVKEPTLFSPTVVLAGSCSDATRAQIAEFGSRFPVLQMALQTNDAEIEADAVIAWCDRVWHSSETCESPLLICSGANREAIEATRLRWGNQQAAELVERCFALVARRLVDRGVQRLVVAGGETSGAVMNELKIRAVWIGREIAPGVPWVQTLNAPLLSLALKSGNFGGPRFFIEALEDAP